MDEERLQSGATIYTFSVLPSSADEQSGIDPLVILGTTFVDDDLIGRVVSGGPTVTQGTETTPSREWPTSPACAPACTSVSTGWAPKAVSEKPAPSST